MLPERPALPTPRYHTALTTIACKWHPSHPQGIVPHKHWLYRFTYLKLQLDFEVWKIFRTGKAGLICFDKTDHNIIDFIAREKQLGDHTNMFFAFNNLVVSYGPILFHFSMKITTAFENGREGF